MDISIQNSNAATAGLTSGLDGASRCSRYAFGPNRLHMCGPDMNREVLAYIDEGLSDHGLHHILRGFQTMYPYLAKIAQANKIRDPFDDLVVEAYWLGNELLDNISQKIFFNHLMENPRIKKHLDWRGRDALARKLAHGARMHHSFHVFNIWSRTGNVDVQHTLSSIDQCRISWGRVVAVSGPAIIVMRRPIIEENNKLALGAPIKTQVMRELEKSCLMDNVTPGDMISMHWGAPCEILDNRQLMNLRKYSAQSLALANQTL